MTQFIVRCADGVVRHEPFTSILAANEWAEWGHCCLARHTIERVVMTPGAGILEVS